MTVLENDDLNLNEEEIARYARHISLSEIGLSGQKRLKASSVVCMGSGGLGSPLLMYLAAAGVGRIGIVDFDVVEESNLQRQVIHGKSWIGQPKTHSARARIIEINPFCKVDVYQTILNKYNALEIIQQYDLVCDCTDNFPSRYLINDACVILGKPNIYGSISKFDGQVTVFNLNHKGPNLRDLIPDPPPIDLIPSCNEAGVLGVLPGLIGLLQATEVIKIITNVGNPLNGRLLTFNALSMRFNEIKIKSNQREKIITKLIEYEGFSFRNELSKNKVKSISIQDLKFLLKKEPESVLLIDVRELSEYKISSINGSHLIPLKNIQDDSNIEKIKRESYGKKIYIYCQSGKRSKKAVLKLKALGIEGINVNGGIEAWNKEIYKS